MARIRVGLVGNGRIAQDQHIPVLRRSTEFELAACASRHCRVDGVANFNTVEEMLADYRQLDAVVVCTPPQAHYEAAKHALMAGKHVFLEKPPCTTTAQLDHLAALASSGKLTLFQSWHLRSAPRVDDAEQWLKPRIIRSGRIVWKENARYRHAGQTWIWQTGGYGVFDPGIDAISILTKILPEPLFVQSAELFFPENCGVPITANLVFRTDSGAVIPTVLDFLSTGEPVWDIEVDTDRGVLKLSSAATALSIDGRPMEYPSNRDRTHAEYEPLYRRFAKLIESGQSEVDATPFHLVADAFLTGKHTIVERLEPSPP